MHAYYYLAYTLRDLKLGDVFSFHVEMMSSKRRDTHCILDVFINLSKKGIERLGTKIMTTRKLTLGSNGTFSKSYTGHLCFVKNQHQCAVRIITYFRSVDATPIESLKTL